MRSLALVLLFSFPALAAPVHVRSTVTKTGEYRQPHVRTTPDHSRANNWSTKGNVNPYTGSKGTKRLYK